MKPEFNMASLKDDVSDEISMKSDKKSEEEVIKTDAV